MNFLQATAADSCEGDGSDIAGLTGARLPRWLLPDGWPTTPDGPALARIDWADGRVTALAPAAAGDTGWNVCGAPVLPGLVEAHTHLDKAFTLPRIEAAGAVRPGLLGAIEAVMADRTRWTADDVTRRTQRGLQWAHEAGTTHLRTHIDWADPAQAPLAWDITAELATQWRDRLRVEQVALVPLRFFADRAQADVIARRVAATGPHAMLGGFVHTSNWDAAALRHLFAAAQDAGLDVDLHVDEELDVRAQGLACTAQLLHDMRFAGRVVCGHNCALAAQPEDQALATLDAVARAPITLVSLPITNLLLQDAATGRTPRLRGLTLVKEARARGIALLFGADNVQDPFCRTGSLDPVDTVQAATLAGQLDSPFDAWSDSLCRADWLGRAPAARMTLVGQRADFVVFPHTDAHGWPSRSGRRHVVRGGAPLKTTTH